MDKDLTAALLCGHHSLDNFDCGHEESNLLAWGFLNQVKALENDDFHALVVADSDGDVTGILVARDLYLLPEMGEAKCLFYFLLAIDREHQHGFRTQRLLLGGIEAIRKRRIVERDDYIGEVAAPLRGAIDAQSLKLVGFLERRQFIRLERDGNIWLRPKDPPANPPQT